MTNKQIPYNTGKVLIGCRYEAPKPSMSYEDEFWQDVLLGGHQVRRLQRMQFICYLAFLVVIITIVAMTAE